MYPPGPGGLGPGRPERGPNPFVRPYGDMTHQNISFVPTRCPFNDRNFHVMPFVNGNAHASDGMSHPTMPVTTGISTMNTVVTGIHKQASIRPAQLLENNNNASSCLSLSEEGEQAEKEQSKAKASESGPSLIELPSMDSNIDGATLESIDLSAIQPISAPPSDQSALIVHPSQEFIFKFYQKLRVVQDILNQKDIYGFLKLQKSTLNPTASAWMPRFGSVSEDRK